MSKDRIISMKDIPDSMHEEIENLEGELLKACSKCSDFNIALSALNIVHSYSIAMIAAIYKNDIGKLLKEETEVLARNVLAWEITEQDIKEEDD